MKLAMQRQAELSALRTRFVSMTSHEFRSPLTLLKSSLELLRDYGARFDEAQRADLFDRMTRAIGRMQDMLDGLMQLGKTELLREKFSPVRCNAVELIGQQAHQAAMTFNVAALGRLRVLNETEDPWCELDAAVMEHILGNLISNALKYSPDGTPVCIRIFGDAATLSLTVEDQGIGIPPDDLPLLFGDFQRAANVRHLPGAGMGLAIVRQMVTLQGGSVDVDSPISADGGCRFTVCVPRRATRGKMLP
jgi:signal transduction histidine kinase